jgi:hypothetical protein
MLGFRAPFASLASLVINPLRSEQEAFRFLIYVVVLVAIVLAIVFALRALL